MATSEMLFGGEYVDNEVGLRASYRCTLNQDSNDEETYAELVVDVNSTHSNGVEENFSIRHRGAIQNSIVLSIVTSALLSYGACVGWRVAGGFLEVMNNAYELSRPRPSERLSIGQRLSAFCGQITRHGPTLRGKVLGALVQCAPNLHPAR